MQNCDSHALTATRQMTPSAGEHTLNRRWQLGNNTLQWIDGYITRDIPKAVSRLKEMDERVSVATQAMGSALLPWCVPILSVVAALAVSDCPHHCSLVGVRR